MWCPVCGSEFRPGFSRCPDCDVALVAEAPTGPLAGLPDREFSSSWPFVETWVFGQEPGAVFDVVAGAMATLGWHVTATDATDRVVGGSIGASRKHLEGEDVEIDVVAQPEGGSRVRFRAQPKLGHDLGMCRTDAARLIAEMERTLGAAAPGRPSPA